MSITNVGIYIDSDTSFYHLSHALDPSTVAVTRDINEFDKLRVDVRLAILHIPFPWNKEFELLVNSIKCDHVFIVGTELHHPIAEFILRNDQARITYFLCGFVNAQLKHSRIYQFMDWFETSTYFYKKWLPEILHRLKPYEIKTRAFDILLGRKKRHRDFVCNQTLTNPGIGIMSYFNSAESFPAHDPEKWIWEHEGLQMDRSPVWTVDPVQYYGHPMSLSQVIPINVYNQTAFSVVAETCEENHYTFFTEKTAKPIIAKRLFVMFAGANYLANLRKLGFMTFDSIIDESYDTELDAHTRWRKAWDQMTWLSEQPQETILEQVRPIAEHNFETMMSTDWYKSFSNQLRQDVARVIAG